MPLLVVLVFWLIVLFVSFGLFAPRNMIVVGSILVSAVSVSAAILLNYGDVQAARWGNSNFERSTSCRSCTPRVLRASLARKGILSSGSFSNYRLLLIQD
jgi:hypothetical protein